MNYKLLIADDKTIILDGLANLVDWPSLGFELIGSCRNGQEVIDAIGQNQVDVILTDIKMPVQSGLDIARYVSENRLPIVVVLISAYKDFQLAREAIQYQVRWYLLKPTKLQEIKAVFTEIKEQLDETRKQNSSGEDEPEDEDIADILERQFHIDLYWGALRDEKALLKRIAELSLSEVLLREPGCLFSITVKPDQVQNSEETALLQRYMQAYTETMTEQDTEQDKVVGKIHLIHFTDNCIRCMATFVEGTSPAEMMRLLQNHLQTGSDELDHLFGLSLQIDIETTYTDVAAFIINRESGHEDSAQEEQLQEDPYRTDFRSVDACIQQICLYLQEEKTEFAISLMHRLLQPQSLQAPGRLPVFATGLFYRLSALLAHASDESSASDAGTTRLAMPDWDHLKSNEEIIVAGEQALQEFTRQAGQVMAQKRHKVIQIATAYIESHIGEALTLEEIAKVIYLSPVYFSKLFKAETGVNYSDYVKKIRIARAIELMQEIQYKVYDVCERVGYKNIRHFYKVFKQVTGMTPTEYRNRQILSGG